MQNYHTSLEGGKTLKKGKAFYLKSDTQSLHERLRCYIYFIEVVKSVIVVSSSSNFLGPHLKDDWSHSPFIRRSPS